MVYKVHTRKYVTRLNKITGTPLLTDFQRYKRTCPYVQFHVTVLVGVVRPGVVLTVGTEVDILEHL
jgi:hypothetical protein